MFFSSWLRSGKTIRQAPQNRFRPALETLEDRCVPAAGFLDATFDFDGVATANVGPSGEESCSAVAIYPPDSANAGKIVAVGSSRDNQGKIDFTLVRYNPDGSLDSSFGTGGIVIKSLASGGDQATAVVLVGDKILVGGYVYGKSGWDFVLARFNANGTLDQTFGNKGKVVTDFGSGSDFGRAMAVQADGKIILAGITYIQGSFSTYGQFAVARYNPNGTLDTTFGKRGRMTIDVGESLYGSDISYRPMELALPGDRIILVGGGAAAESTGTMYVVQLTAAGQLDPTFGTGGVVPLADGYSAGLAVQPDGKLVIASIKGFRNISGIRVTRLFANGSLDTGFGADGMASLAMSSYARSSSVEIDALGRIVVGGWDAPYGETGKFFVARFTAAGAVDTSFGVDGVGTSGDEVMAYGTRSPVALALQADGKIVLVGEAKEGSDYMFAAVRFEDD